MIQPNFGIFVLGLFVYVSCSGMANFVAGIKEGNTLDGNVKTIKGMVYLTIVIAALIL